jgi:hypothetical protein
MTQEIIDALIAKYNADIMISRANLFNYLNNSTGVGEHPNIVKECDKLISKISDAEGKIESLRKIILGIKEKSAAKLSVQDASDKVKKMNPIKTGNESSNNRK